jgi:membrane-associated phospholipid phosphatase
MSARRLILALTDGLRSDAITDPFFFPSGHAAAVTAIAATALL